MWSSVQGASGLRHGRVEANGIEFGVLEAGSGPLALCLHGFPDSAYTWRHLLPELARAGFRAVAPFMRGYAPTAVAADGCYGAAAVAPERWRRLVTISVAPAALDERIFSDYRAEEPGLYHRGAADVYAAEHAAVLRTAPQPTLYLHGGRDGCVDVALVADAERHLAAGSRMEIIEDAGHFPHLERADAVNERILAWVN